MTIKNKAEKLILTMHGIENDPNHYMSMFNAKQCALVAIDEIINYLTTSLDVQISLSAVNYWEEVKQEIEKL